MTGMTEYRPRTGRFGAARPRLRQNSRRHRRRTKIEAGRIGTWPLGFYHKFEGATDRRWGSPSPAVKPGTTGGRVKFMQSDPTVRRARGIAACAFANSRATPRPNAAVALRAAARP